MELPDRGLDLWIVKKLVRKRCWGKGHLSEDNLIKGQDRSYKRRILGRAEVLRREGILVAIPHGREKHYYLNPTRRKMIYRIIESLQ